MAEVKYVVVCCDGMSDRPLKELSGLTPVEAADTPNMDFVAANGRMGSLKTIVDGLPKDSGVANLAILGYDPKKFYPGRGPLEAANMKVSLKPQDVVLRCNIVTEKDGLLIDYSGGHISSDESRKLIEDAGKVFGGEGVSFHAGVSYRHIILLRDGYSEKLLCQPPHDIIGRPVKENLIRPAEPSAKETADELNRIMLESGKVFGKHPVNENRVKVGKNPGNMLWFWGPGRKPEMPSFKEKFGLSGSVISAVDIIKGIGVAVGLDVVNVPGATGYLDTNYEGKADAAIKSLRGRDFVYVHVESPDESGHERNAEHKIQAIEDIDKKVVGTILKGIEGDFVLGVLPDHATPVSVGTHTEEPVPFAIYSTLKEKGGRARKYSEKEAVSGEYGLKKGTDFMNLLIEAGKH